VIDALANLPGGASVLDIGCGNGCLAAELSGRGLSVTGIDASWDGIVLAQQAYPGVRFLRASVYDEEWFDAVGRVDAVIASEVLEHLFRPRVLLRAARRVSSLRACWS